MRAYPSWGGPRSLQVLNATQLLGWAGVVILVLYAVLRPAVLWASSPTDPCTSLRIIHLLVYPDGACAVEQLSAEARDLACRAGPGFVGGGPAVEGSPLGRWSLPTMWLFKVLETALGRQYERLYFGDLPVAGTTDLYQLYWARNSDWALLQDAIYSMLSLGSLRPRQATVQVLVTPGTGSVASCVGSDGTQRLAQLTFDAGTSCPDLMGVVAVAHNTWDSVPGWRGGAHAEAHASQYIIKGCGPVPDNLVLPWDPNSLLRAAFLYSSALAGALAVLLTARVLLLYKRYRRTQLALLQERLAQLQRLGVVQLPDGHFLLHLPSSTATQQPSTCQKSTPRAVAEGQEADGNEQQEGYLDESGDSEVEDLPSIASSQASPVPPLQGTAPSSPDPHPLHSTVEHHSPKGDPSQQGSRPNSGSRASRSTEDGAAEALRQLREFMMSGTERSQDGPSKDGLRSSQQVQHGADAEQPSTRDSGDCMPPQHRGPSNPDHEGIGRSTAQKVPAGTAPPESRSASASGVNAADQAAPAPPALAGMLQQLVDFGLNLATEEGAAALQKMMAAQGAESEESRGGPAGPENMSNNEGQGSAEAQARAGGVRQGEQRATTGERQSTSVKAKATLAASAVTYGAFQVTSAQQQQQAAAATSASTHATSAGSRVQHASSAQAFSSKAQAGKVHATSAAGQEHSVHLKPMVDLSTTPSPRSSREHTTAIPPGFYIRTRLNQVYHLSFDDAPRFKAVNIVRALLGLRYYVQLTPWAATSPVASIEAAVSGAVDGMTSGPTSAFVENLDAEFERARQRNVCRWYSSLSSGPASWARAYAQAKIMAGAAVQALTGAHPGATVKAVQGVVGTGTTSPAPGCTGVAPGNTAAVQPVQPLAFGGPLGLLLGNGTVGYPDEQDPASGFGMPGEENMLRPGSVYAALYARGHSVLGLAGVLELITDALVSAFKEIGGHLQQRVAAVVMAALIDQQRLMQVVIEAFCEALHQLHLNQRARLDALPQGAFYSRAYKAVQDDVTAAAQNLTRSAVADLLNLRGSKHPSRGNASYKSDDNADHGWFSMGLGIMRQMAHAIQRHALRVLCSAVEKQVESLRSKPPAVSEPSSAIGFEVPVSESVLEVALVQLRQLEVDLDSAPMKGINPQHLLHTLTSLLRITWLWASTLLGIRAAVILLLASLIPALTGLAAVAAGSMWLLDSWTPAPSYLVLIPAVLTAVLVALDGCWARGVSWGDLGGSAARHLPISRSSRVAASPSGSDRNSHDSELGSATTAWDVDMEPDAWEADHWTDVDHKHTSSTSTKSPPFRVLGGLAVRHALHLLMLVQLVAGLWYLLMVAGWISVAALLGHTAALPIVSVAASALVVVMIALHQAKQQVNILASKAHSLLSDVGTLANAAWGVIQQNGPPKADDDDEDGDYVNKHFLPAIQHSPSKAHAGQRTKSRKKQHHKPGQISNDIHEHVKGAAKAQDLRGLISADNFYAHASLMPLSIMMGASASGHAAVMQRASGMSATLTLLLASLLTFAAVMAFLIIAVRAFGGSLAWGTAIAAPLAGLASSFSGQRMAKARTKGALKALPAMVNSEVSSRKDMVHGKESVNPRSAPDMHASSSGAGGRDYSAELNGLSGALSACMGQLTALHNQLGRHPGRGRDSNDGGNGSGVSQAQLQEVLQNLYSFLAALNWGTPDKQTMGSFGPVTISNISTSSLDARLARVDNRMARMESVTNACWKEVSRMEALFRADLLSIKESAVRLEASVAQIIRAVAKFTVGITTNNDNRTINNVTPGVTPKPDLDPDMYRNLVAILKEHTRTLLEAREVGQKVLVTTTEQHTRVTDLQREVTTLESRLTSAHAASTVLLNMLEALVAMVSSNNLDAFVAGLQRVLTLLRSMIEIEPTATGACNDMFEAVLNLCNDGKHPRWLEELRNGLQGLWVADWAVPEGSTQVVDSVMDVVVKLQTHTRQLLPGPEGPQGLQGPQGIQGPQGPPGPPGGGINGLMGPPGPKGEKGDPGPKGDKGDSGPQGAKGDKGDQGPKGANGGGGAPGPKGDQGPQGPKGHKGEKGEKGDKGDQGEKGDPGPKGEEGPPGPPGPTIIGQDNFTWDPSMFRGEKGDKGDKGDPGDVGPKGEKGDKGDKGDPGGNGPQGEKGDKGDKGDSGIINGTWDPSMLKGEKGDTGDKGDPGEKGDQGPKGEKGNPGGMGPQGERGDKGDIGPPGEKGEKGEKGDQGEKGDKGDPGGLLKRPESSAMRRSLGAWEAPDGAGKRSGKGVMFDTAVFPVTPYAPPDAPRNNLVDASGLWSYPEGPLSRQSSNAPALSRLATSRLESNRPSESGGLPGTADGGGGSGNFGRLLPQRASILSQEARSRPASAGRASGLLSAGPSGRMSVRTDVLLATAPDTAIAKEVQKKKEQLGGLGPAYSIQPVTQVVYKPAT